MKQLTCEMCGSTDIMKQDGVFVCQTCGTKYSVEEAKKMMVEGTVEVQGTVRVDSSDKVENYLSMAKSAYAANNVKESEIYANKIIEIEPKNIEAWLIKGKSAGWQSTLGNIRFSEALSFFAKAVNFSMNEDEKNAINSESANGKMKISEFTEDIIHEACEESENLSKALIKLRCNQFVQFTDDDTVKDIIELRTMLSKLYLEFITGWAVYSNNLKEISVLEEINEIIYDTVKTAWKNAVNEYHEERFPGKYAFERFLAKGNACSNLLLVSPLFINKDKDDEVDIENEIEREQMYIEIEEKIIDSCSWDYEYIDYERDMPGGEARVINKIKSKGFVPDPKNNRYWFKQFTLTKDTIENRRTQIDKSNKHISELKNKIKEKHEKLQKEKNEAYWKEHSDEKAALEKELESLKSISSELQPVIDKAYNEIILLKRNKDAITPSEKELSSMKAKISDLSSQRDNLGVFKGREKKQLTEQISHLENEINILSERAKKERQEHNNSISAQIKDIEESVKTQNTRFTEIQKRIEEINVELTKDR